MAYRVGYCPQCGDQILVRDTDRKWNSIKKNYRKADIHMGDGTRISIPICSRCLAAPDLNVLMASLVAEGSVAGNKKTMDLLKTKGAPVKIQEKVS